MNSSGPGDSIVKARQALVFGQHDRLWTATEQALGSDQGPGTRAVWLCVPTSSTMRVPTRRWRPSCTCSTTVRSRRRCSLRAAVEVSSRALIPLRPIFRVGSRGPVVGSAESRRPCCRRLLELPETSPVAPDSRPISPGRTVAVRHRLIEVDRADRPEFGWCRER